MPTRGILLHTLRAATIPSTRVGRSRCLPTGLLLALLIPSPILALPDLATPVAETTRRVSTEPTGRPDDWKVEVNLPARELRVYTRDVSANTTQNWRVWGIFAVAVGTKRHPTPLVETRLEAGIARPDWAAPNQEWAGEFAGKVVPFMAPGNPFRTRNEQAEWEGYFIPLSGTSVGLHSTNQRSSIGSPASHGCIRMRLDDVRLLYRTLPRGTLVATTYRLYECTLAGDSISIRSFPDIYRRLNAEERLAQLQVALAEVGRSADKLDPSSIEALVTRPGFNLTLLLSDDYVSPSVASAPPMDVLNHSLLATLNHLHESASTP